MTCQKHMSRIDADDGRSRSALMLTLRNHASSRHAPATSHHVPQAPERRSLSAYLSHSPSPAVSSSSSAYSPSPSRSPLLVCALASDLRGGRLHVTSSDSRLAFRGCCGSVPPSRHVTSRPRRQRPTNGQRRTAICRHGHQYVRQRPRPRPRPCAITEYFDDSR